jgi:Tfp pilus assembly protein PilZ
MNYNIIVTLESLKLGINENSRMVNCSDNGLYFESDQFLQPGTEIFIRIEDFVEDQIEAYKCHHAKVIWGKRLNKKPYAYGYGVKYVSITNNEKSQDDDSGQINDLRKHPRMYCGKLATFGFENKLYNGFISNISRNGCFIECVELLNIRQILDLVITGTKFSKNNILKVEVVRLSPNGVGAKFKSIRRKNPKE